MKRTLVAVCVCLGATVSLLSGATPGLAQVQGGTNHLGGRGPNQDPWGTPNMPASGSRWFCNNTLTIQVEGRQGNRGNDYSAHYWGTIWNFSPGPMRPVLQIRTYGGGGVPEIPSGNFVRPIIAHWSGNSAPPTTQQILDAIIVRCS